MKISIDNTLFGLAVLLLPISVGLLFFVSPAITFIPKYVKWEPALASFYIFVITAAIAAFSTALTNALNAIGKIRQTLQLMILWTVSGWVLTLLFVRFFGFIGVPLALLVISGTIVIVVAMVRRFVKIEIIKNFRTPVFGILLQAGLYILLRDLSFGSWQGLIGVGLLGVILYGVVVWIFEHKRIAHLYETKT